MFPMHLVLPCLSTNHQAGFFFFPPHFSSLVMELPSWKRFMPSAISFLWWTTRSNMFQQVHLPHVKTIIWSNILLKKLSNLVFIISSHSKLRWIMVPIKDVAFHENKGCSLPLSSKLIASYLLPSLCLWHTIFNSPLNFYLRSWKYHGGRDLSYATRVAIVV